MRQNLLIAGGGLSGGLIALALAARRPDVAVTLVEEGAMLGGNHIWSFFDGDVAAANGALVDPLVGRRWPDHEVSFPGHARRLPQGYSSIRSDELDAALRRALPPERIVHAKVARVGSEKIVLADGAMLAGHGVIDARGAGDPATLDLGWQKFVGRLLEVAGGHGVTRPVIMDATVEQLDGYRFVYLLPFDDTHLFVEDTYYSDSPLLDRDLLAARIDAYAAARGWRVAAITHEETGVLPVVIGGDLAAYWGSTGADIAKAGVRAGLFHATTGYSLPDAARLAAAIADLPDLSGANLAAFTRRFAERAWKARGFYRLLDAMLFRAADPVDRYRIMERFYRLSPALIGRFYAARSTMADKARILVGKPPVPVGRAIGAIMRSRR